MFGLGLPIVFQERRHPAGKFLSVMVHFDDTMYDFYRFNAGWGCMYLPTVWEIGNTLGERLQDVLGELCLSEPITRAPRLPQIKQGQYKGFIAGEAMLSFGNFRPKQPLDTDRARLYARNVADVLVPYLLGEKATAHNPDRPIRVAGVETVPQKEYTRIEVWAPFTEEERWAILSRDLSNLFSGRAMPLSQTWQYLRV